MAHPLNTFSSTSHAVTWGASLEQEAVFWLSMVRLGVLFGVLLMEMSHRRKRRAFALDGFRILERPEDVGLFFYKATVNLRHLRPDDGVQCESFGLGGGGIDHMTVVLVFLSGCVAVCVAFGEANKSCKINDCIRSMACL